MAIVDPHPWLRFITGLIAGCWGGVVIGCAITLLLAGRRLRQLETANLILRVKLKAAERPKRRTPAGAGPVLVVPPGSASRPASAPMSRYANGGR